MHIVVYLGTKEEGTVKRKSQVYRGSNFTSLLGLEFYLIPHMEASSSNPLSCILNIEEKKVISVLFCFVLRGNNIKTLKSKHESSKFSKRTSVQ